MIGIIYKLTDNSEKVYYGSTTRTLKHRLIHHRCIANHCRSKIMDKDSMKIECLEEFNHHLDFILKELLIKREGYYIRNFECINHAIPGRTKKEYNANPINKERHALRTKKYTEGNKEKISLKGKEYYEKNKEELLTKHKEYQEKNKEKLRAKFICECGGKYTYEHKSTHNKSKKHIAYSLSTKSS